MIPKMGRDSQGSTSVYACQFIYVLFMPFSSFMLYLCSPSSFIVLFIALLICFELFIALICRSEYIYRFVYIYYVVNIILRLSLSPPSPRVFGRENPQLVLVDYVRPQRGINNYVNPRGIYPRTQPPCPNFVIYYFTTL